MISGNDSKEWFTSVAQVKLVHGLMLTKLRKLDYTFPFQQAITFSEENNS